MTNSKEKYGAQSGNILFMILIAIVLIGLLTVAIQSTTHPGDSGIDKETLVVRVSEVQRYASELERGVRIIVQDNGKSESDIRFAHQQASADYGDLGADADPTDQVFSPRGGAVGYQAPPASVNDGSAWEFYGGTHIPGIGTSAPDLVAVLPNVTQEFCDKINELDGQSGTPTDTGAAAAMGASPGSCINIGALGRFDDGQQFYATANTMDETTFTQDPATSAVRPAAQACVKCTLGGGNYFYHVLLAR